MKALLMVALLSLLASQAHAYKLVLLTDEPNAAKAIDVKNLITTTLPFKLLRPNEFSVEIHKVSQQIECHSKVIKYTSREIDGLANQLKKLGQTLTKEQRKKYHDGFSIDRLVECDRTAIASEAASYGADRVVFFHQSPFEGGSGGDIPIVLSSSGSGVGMHEWLHTFGLADEYQFNEAEANISMYCLKPRWMNLAVFEPHSFYSSTADVVRSHESEISWLSGLPNDSALIHGNQLGSPDGQKLGIFPAKTCNNQSPARSSWHASSYPSNMENTNSPYIPKPWWPALLTAMGIAPDRLMMVMTVPDPLRTLKVLVEPHPQPKSGDSVQ